MTEQFDDGYREAMIERYGREAWEAYLQHEADEAERHERECGVSIEIGPSHDPYGTTCERDRGHDGWHAGADPFGRGPMLRWRGGGTLEGDPLPFTLKS